MTTAVQRRRGTNTEHASFTGLEGELSVNTTNESVHVHDGSTAGGFELARADASNIVATSIDINGGTIDGTAIGASSASTGAFTTLTATGLTVNNTTAFSYLPVSTAGSVVGTIGTGSGTIFNTPSVNASYGSGLAIDGSYSSDVSTINLKAFGPKFSSYSSQLAFHTSSGTSLTERMRIDSSGNVGVGTTSPSRVLSAKSSSVTVANFESTSGTAGFVSFSDSNTTNDVTVRAGAVGDNLALQAGGAERMRIDSSGNVGIGNSSPSTRLTVGAGSGSEEIRVDAGAGWADLRLHSDATNGGSIYFNDGADAGQIFYYHPDNSMRFHTNATERARLTSDGNLLVGQTSPDNTVNGSRLSGSGTSWFTATNDYPMGLNRKSSDGILLWFGKDGSNVGTISTNANSLPSDRNFKRNIKDLTLGLDFVESLNPVTYNYKIDDEGQAVMAGLIAQEVEESLTAAGVEKNSMTLLQHSPTEDVNESDYQMDYLKFVPILINSIKEQQTLIESLTARIAALEE